MLHLPLAGLLGTRLSFGVIVMIRIAVVEDNEDFRDEVLFHLHHAGYEVTGLADGAALDRYLIDHACEVLVLDLGLSGEDGLAIARRLAGRPDLGIVMLTARGALDDRLAGINGGADAYLVKPVDFRELVTVVKGVARRLRLAIATRTAWRVRTQCPELIAPDEQAIPLTEAEWRLLRALAESHGEAVCRDRLIHVLGHRRHVYDERRLEALVSRLRAKLTAHGDAGSMLLRSVRCVGYRFGALLRIES
jgi:DNA-binding response OmpR family regulator